MMWSRKVMDEHIAGLLAGLPLGPAARSVDGRGAVPARGGGALRPCRRLRPLPRTDGLPLDARSLTDDIAARES